MKQSKLIGILLAVVNSILILLCVFLYLRTDRSRPEIEFQASDVIYREGMEKEGLLSGVTAYDREDGDLTKRVVVERISEDREENTAVVFYAVSDKARNVAKASRVFQAVFHESSNGKKEAEEAADLLLEAGIAAELNEGGSAEGAYYPAESEEAGQEERETESPEMTPEPTSEPTGAPLPSPTPVKTPEPIPEPTPEPTPRPQPTVNPGIPVLTLKVSEVQVNAGQGPAWVNLIDTLKDDKDSYETLFGNLSVSKYDKDKPGTYQVTVTTEDSDGNKSAAVPLTIVVK